jgi:P27 family predicted phage terminase small subunit
LGGKGSGGRNAKSTRVKKREGNRGHRKLNEKEPKAPAGEPKMPLFVKKNVIARATWHNLVPLLLDMKVLNKAHGLALGGLCVAVSQLAMAEAALAKYGLINARTLDKETGFAVLSISPAQRIKSDALRHIRAGCMQFGLDPSAASRLHVDFGESAQDAADDFFAGEDTGDVVQ